MDDAWQSQDIAPASSGIGIPTDAGLNNGAAMSTDDQNWSANGNGRSPGRDRHGGEPPRRSSRSRSPGGPPREERGVNPGNNLHVSGLSHKIDTRELEAAFAKHGRVKKASVMYDPHTRESRGFGFVTMETAEDADSAIAALNSTELMGKVMNVEKARRGRARTPTPGRYYGPPKRSDFERPYDPRPYDSRYSRDYDDRRGGGSERSGGGGGRGGGGGGGRYDDRGGRDYDRHRDYDRGDRDRGERSYGGGREGGGREGGGRDRYDDRRH
ncbi:hypothetical protein B0H34DRAFT_681132 [Crassisporium funariophilum]|nr:hypothetical protein B0H34DRAFT_681132 [Crassisporium funariophilum]